MHFGIAHRIRITLLEAQAHVLSMFSRSLVEYSEEKFKRESIDVLTNSLVTKVGDKTVTIKHLDTQKVTGLDLIWVLTA
jgi:NADH:ubiquinone reductase (non-electrogenic)